MKATLTTSQAAAMLKADTSANWSHAGARALIEYLEQIEEDTGTEIEFDAVAIRCDYSEYSSALEAALDQGFEPNPNLGEEAQSEEDKEADALSWLQDHTQVIEFSGGVIIQNF
jgi:phosphosulfolactate synthase (CoM biosynthesis protein A)